jgi:hypothetical protein
MDQHSFEIPGPELLSSLQALKGLQGFVSFMNSKLRSLQDGSTLEMQQVWASTAFRLTEVPTINKAYYQPVFKSSDKPFPPPLDLDTPEPKEAME